MHELLQHKPLILHEQTNTPPSELDLRVRNLHLGRVSLVDYRSLLTRGSQALSDDELFREAVRGALEYELFEGERDLGVRCGVSRSQVNRWKNGRSLPMVPARKAVYALLKTRATRRLNHLGSAAPSPASAV